VGGGVERKRANLGVRLHGRGGHSCSLPARNYVLNNSFNNFALCDGIYENAETPLCRSPLCRGTWKVPVFHCTHVSAGCSSHFRLLNFPRGLERNKFMHCVGSLNVEYHVERALPARYWNLSGSCGRKLYESF